MIFGNVVDKFGIGNVTRNRRMAAVQVRDCQVARLRSQKLGAIHLVTQHNNNALHPPLKKIKLMVVMRFTVKLSVGSELLEVRGLGFASLFRSFNIALTQTCAV